MNARSAAPPPRAERAPAKTVGKSASNKGKSKERAGQGLPKVSLIFAENKNDADSIAHLSKAIWAQIPTPRYRRHPLVLIRDKQQAEDRKKNAADILGVVKAEQVLNDVCFVFAHKDCDAVEPAHVAQAKAMKVALAAQGLANVVPVAPAWETETWWFMWPDAVAAVNAKWTRLKRKGNHGMITDAKETLRRDLRNANTRRDYQESDSPTIAANVLSLGIIDQRIGSSESFTQFRRELREVAGLS
jgi:hypothetical protein